MPLNIFFVVFLLSLWFAARWYMWKFKIRSLLLIKNCQQCQHGNYIMHIKSNVLSYGLDNFLEYLYVEIPLPQYHCDFSVLYMFSPCSRNCTNSTTVRVTQKNHTIGNSIQFSEMWSNFNKIISYTYEARYNPKPF